MVKQVDLVIVGAGPAGLMAAAWAAVYGIKTLVLDMRPDRIQNGHADGLQSRTIEILHSFGFGKDIYDKANRLQEVCFWNPGKDGIITRTDRIPDTIPRISRFQQSVIHQGVIEQHFLDFIQSHSPGQVEIVRPAKPVKLQVDESQFDEDDSYPITVEVERIQSNVVGGSTIASTPEVIHSKYLLGSDGAHSWVREQLGITMEGEQTELVWGVMDVIPITNFPDIRMRCTVHSASFGTIMVIPRERGLVRLYIQLANLRPERGERFDKSKASIKTIFEAATKILSPYELSYEYCEWWTVYQIGQRVANAFTGYHDRIFLAGDAVHTHSPKAGQGMNVSMQDAYNLGWKVASVVQKKAHRSILSTYESERRPIAQQLIEFDRRFSKMFSGRPARDVADEAGISMAEFKTTFLKGNIFTSGISVKYAPSSVISDQPLRSTCKATKDEKELSFVLESHHPQLGMRFPSFQVVSQADATPLYLGSRLVSDGRWRLIVFAGDISNKDVLDRLRKLGSCLDAPGSIWSRLLTKNILEPILVHASPRCSVELFDLPEVFYRAAGTAPRAKAKKPYDYYRTFADDTSYHQGHGDAYALYGIDKNQGASLIIRPDQYVGWLGNVDDLAASELYLRSIFRT